MHEQFAPLSDEMFRQNLARIWNEVEQLAVAGEFLNVEGGSVEQVRDYRLRLHHCANYAAAFTTFAAADRPMRILELGCGSGILSAAFARLMPSDWTLYATDYSSRLIESARTRYQFANVRFECININDLKPDFLKNFDAVMFLEVIEHLVAQEVVTLFSRLYSGLTAGGMVVISTVDRSPFKRQFSGYAPHKIEYRYATLHDFLNNKEKNPFEQVEIFRLTSRRIVQEAVRSEDRGGYFLNRLVGLVKRITQRQRWLVSSTARLVNFSFRVYDRFMPKKRFNVEEYLKEVRFITRQPELFGAESFSLVAILRKMPGKI
ncbi:MAG: class I SAM-dependent methyltransferase [candidate division WOR-3 bacterium]|nr:class I SAM-dependent methyltransferase [candidate division WOR-3 bacterium]